MDVAGDQVKGVQTKIKMDQMDQFDVDKTTVEVDVHLPWDEVRFAPGEYDNLVLSSGETAQIQKELEELKSKYEKLVKSSKGGQFLATMKDKKIQKQQEEIMLKKK